MVNALMPRFTDCTFKFLNKTMQKRVVNGPVSCRRQTTLCNTREAPGRAAGFWSGSRFPRRATTSLLSVQGCTPPTARATLVLPCPPSTRHSCWFQPPSKLPIGCKAKPMEQPHAISSSNAGYAARLGESQVIPLTLPKHSTDPLPSVHGDNQAPRALMSREGDGPQAHSPPGRGIRSLPNYSITSPP